jgi:hypothetical protein
MNKLFWCGALAAALMGSATPAAAGDINLTIANGRVTLIAQDVTVRQILAEWARVGETQILNGDKMMGGPLTLELRDVPEAKALDIVLRSAAGYVVAPRLTGHSGGSEYGRIVILATSQAPPVSAAPPSFNPMQRPIPQQIIPPPQNANPNDDTEPANMVPPGQPFPGQPNQPGMPPGMQPGMEPMQQQPMQQQPQGPITAPRPGPIPQPVGPGGATQTQPGRPTRPGGGGEGMI